MSQAIVLYMSIVFGFVMFLLVIKGVTTWFFACYLQHLIKTHEDNWQKVRKNFEFVRDYLAPHLRNALEQEPDNDQRNNMRKLIEDFEQFKVFFAPNSRTNFYQIEIFESWQADVLRVEVLNVKVNNLAEKIHLSLPQDIILSNFSRN